MGTVYQLKPSEMQRHENVGFSRVAPVAVRSLQPPAPPPPERPAMSSPALKSVCRNLFNVTPVVGEIGEMLAKQEKKNADKVKLRFGFDLRESCNQQQISISALRQNEVSAPYSLSQGVKRTCEVLKANTAISNVPKRIRDDNLSSEKGQKEGETKEEAEAEAEVKKEKKKKKKDVQQQKEQQHEGEEAEDKQRQ